MKGPLKRYRKAAFPLFLFTCLLGSFITLLSCLSLKPLRPPTFHYPKLTEHYFRTKLGSHFPLTLQREVNLQASASHNGFLFYTSTISGSGDIWMRDLKNTNNFPIVKHPAEQYKATVNANGDHMVFVSEDRDEDGDLRFLTLKPERISEQHLRGLSPPKLWDKSVNLSLSIEKWSRENLGKECQGNFLETDPDLNAKGDLLLFVSERCTPGLPNLWLAKLEDEEVITLEQLSQLGGKSPRFSPAPYENRIVFLSHREGKKEGAIYVLELNSKNQKEIEVSLPQNSKRSFLYFSPDFLGDSNTLVYSSIREDTNEDGILNQDDQGGIYSLSLASSFSSPKKESLYERRLLETSTVLHGLSYTKLLGGAIFYAATLYNSINIYFIPAQGVIPKEKNIEEQYLLSQRYAIENEKRYAMAQKAVLDYHKNDPKYLHYEAQLFIDSLEFHRKRNDLRLLGQVQNEIKRHLILTGKDKNPYLPIYHEIYTRKQKNPDSLLAYLQAMQKEAHSQGKRSIQALLQHKLAEEYRRLKKFHDARATIQDLNSQYPDYLFRRSSLFFQAEMEQKKDPKLFPPILKTMFQENRKEEEGESGRSREFS